MFHEIIRLTGGTNLTNYIFRFLLRLIFGGCLIFGKIHNFPSNNIGGLVRCWNCHMFCLLNQLTTQLIL